MCFFVIAGAIHHRIPTNCLCVIRCPSEALLIMKLIWKSKSTRSQAHELPEKPAQDGTEMSIKCDVSEIMIPSMTTGSENAFLEAIQPMTESTQLPDMRMTAGSNTAFLSMGFNSPFGDQVTFDDVLDTSPHAHSAISGLVHSPVEVFNGHKATINTRNTGETVNEIRRIWAGHPQSTTRSHFWHDIAFDSVENIFSSQNTRTFTEPVQGMTYVMDATDVNLTGETKQRLRRLKQTI